MSLHQILYTSCRRGIDGINDGQQIYSYDSRLSDAQKEEVRPLFTYTQPRLPEGEEMTDEMAKTMPQSFTYLQFPSGDCAVALNTYLGRDYMGEGGRFGNHLSHVIVAEEPDFTIYPCEMFQSPALRSSMKYEEVNSEQKPDYLPAPSLIPGNAVTLDAVTEFLQSDEDHMLFYKRMADAMLRGRDEKKRLVICDTPERLLLWIGALNYTLPQQLAKRIGFTTYSADPSLSRALICGVLPEGTAYSASEYCGSGNFFVFDFLHQMASPDEYTENAFIDFIDVAFSFNVESLQNFHTFLLDHTSYRDTNTQLYSCYDLYRLVTQGMDDITEQQFDVVTEFAGQYCGEDMAQEICSHILDIQTKIGTFDNSYVMKMLQFLLKHFQGMDRESQAGTRKLVIEHILRLLSDTDIQEEEWHEFYSGTDKIARSIGLSIPAVLISGNRGDELEAILYNRKNPKWKIYQILEIFCAYVKDRNLPANSLDCGDSPGKLLCAAAETFYRASPAAGQKAAEKIMSFFENDSRYYVRITQSMEEALREAGAKQDMIDSVWLVFDGTARKYTGKDADNVFGQLIAGRRYDSLYQLYQHQMDDARNLHDKDLVFRGLLRTFTDNPEYRAGYYIRAVRDYFRRVKAYHPSDEQEEACKNKILYDLMDLCIQDRIDDAVTDRLQEYICDRIVIYRQSDADARFVNNTVNFYNQGLHRQIEGRLLLLYSWNMLDQCGEEDQIGKFTDIIFQAAGDNRISPDLLKDERERKQTVKKFTALPCEIRPVTGVLIDYYGLFNFTSDAHVYFFKEIRKSYSEKENGRIDCDIYADFIRFLCACGTDADIDDAGEALSGLKPERLDEMDNRMKKLLKGNLKEYRLWQRIRDKAESTNPFTNTIKNVFGRFRKA